MKIAFKIAPEVNNSVTNSLLIEISNEEIAMLFYTSKPFVLHGLYQFYFDKNTSINTITEGLKTFLQTENILDKSFAKVNIFYNYKENVLVPKAFYNEAENINAILLLHGLNNNTKVFNDLIVERDIQIIYRVPNEMHELVNNLFPDHNYTHSSTQRLRPLQNDGNVLECIVYQNKLKVILSKTRELQIVQFFDYDSTSDVCFHLLNVCEQFNVPLPSVQLLLSGMIDEFSNLYKELYKYFLNIQFVQIPSGVEVDRDLRKQPHHYYSHLSALAQCV